jgi:hypothetical protein
VITFREYYIISEGTDVVADKTLTALPKREVKKKTSVNKEPRVSRYLDILQLALDTAGIATIGVPAVESAINATNAIVSALRAASAKTPNKRKKHLINAGINVISIIPGAALIKFLRLRKAPAIAKTVINLKRAVDTTSRVRSAQSAYKLAKLAKKSLPKDVKQLVPSLPNPGR